MKKSLSEQHAPWGCRRKGIPFLPRLVSSKTILQSLLTQNELHCAVNKPRAVVGFYAVPDLNCFVNNTHVQCPLACLALHCFTRLFPNNMRSHDTLEFTSCVCMSIDLVCVGLTDWLVNLLNMLSLNTIIEPIRQSLWHGLAIVKDFFFLVEKSQTRSTDQKQDVGYIHDIGYAICVSLPFLLIVTNTG